MRYKDYDWDIPERLQDWTQANTAVLMDIRDELKEIRRRLAFGLCADFLAVPLTLKQIQRNTTKRKRGKK